MMRSMYGNPADQPLHSRCVCVAGALVALAASAEVSSFDAQCFSDGEAGSIDRSETTISLLVQDWVSHELVTFAAAFVLKEWLGYNVELVRLQSLPNNEENLDRQNTLREGVWDVDLESWIEIADSEHRSKMASLLEPATPIGFSGRSGLYVMPAVVEQEKYADWYKYYLTPGLTVVWYSWSSNWGADFYGGVRISLPDPASSSVVQGYTPNPNGSLAVDYPDVVLLKLLAKTLFPRAPEAYWLLNNFKISPSELYELLGQTGTRSVQERMDAACQWLKSKRERFLTSLSRFHMI
eukprot:Skav202067  [mRNA]  locus=scaffold1138:668046:673744:- [translate_table: standard]